MTIALAIAFNAVLAAALIGALVTAMSRAARLRPHVPAIDAAASRPVAPTQAARSRRSRRPDLVLVDVHA
jgi:hypothetical protein